MCHLAHTFNMRTKLRFTDDEWAELARKAEVLYPGRGLTHMITLEINKHLRKIGVLDNSFNNSCTPPDKEIIMQPRPYTIPDDLIDVMECVCNKKRIGVASYISRYVLQKHLDG